MEEKNEKRRIGIIGAGLSGLIACKHAVEKGLSPVVFEARGGIGGVWSSQTIHCTKLQIPKSFYQFSDFPWPPSVSESYPHHTRVLEYIDSYALHFRLLPLIRFNSTVLSIRYVDKDDHEIDGDGDLWGGAGEPFSRTAKWNLTVQDTRQPSSPPTVFCNINCILCCVCTIYIYNYSVSIDFWI